LARFKYQISNVKSRLPQPVLPAHADWVELYWLAWSLLAGQMKRGTPENGFAQDYLDAGFSENIFQWDTCFIAAFARYGGHVFPVGPSLDNFYSKQHDDGFICREIGPDGADYWPKSSEQSINPPLFAWAEWLCYQISGDKKRLRRVLPHLDRYYNWVAYNHRMADGLYWTSNMGSGMDNSPRCGWQWVDITAQQALAARMLNQIAHRVKDGSLEAHYRTEYDELVGRINRLMWDEQDEFYHDTLHRAHMDCGFARCKTLAGFWPLLAGIVPPDRTARLVAHLQNPSEFGRPHPFPTLSADHSSYMPTGGYWLGGVWPPTTYMVIKGLAANGYADLARRSAERHLEHLAQVVAETGTLWEDYAPESAAPGLPSRPNFVGWTGLGPVAMLIEDVLGIEVDAPTQAIHWRLRQGETHGIRNLRMGGNVVNLLFEDRQCHVKAAHPFTLILVIEGKSREYHVGQDAVLPCEPGG
jgi:glycogen debranching enzyme